jgi:hypothetical protein
VKDQEGLESWRGDRWGKARVRVERVRVRRGVWRCIVVVVLVVGMEVGLVEMVSLQV